MQEIARKRFQTKACIAGARTFLMLFNVIFWVSFEKKNFFFSVFEKIPSIHLYHESMIIIFFSSSRSPDSFYYYLVFGCVFPLEKYSK